MVSLLIHRKNIVEMEKKEDTLTPTFLPSIHKVEPIMDLSGLLGLRLCHNEKFLYYLEIYWGKNIIWSCI